MRIENGEAVGRLKITTMMGGDRLLIPRRELVALPACSMGWTDKAGRPMPSPRKEGNGVCRWIGIAHP